MKADEAALADQLLAMADDELILGHRNSEWTGHAPILEEDIAFANIAQDEIGHAATWYGLLNTITGQDPDELVFFRDAGAYRNIQMVELPKGDWAFTMLRQYLFDEAEAVRLAALETSRYGPLAQAAAAIRPEETYHLRHTGLWVRRLGQGTQESRRRMQAALDGLWPFAFQMFVPLPQESRLVENGYIPAVGDLSQAWQERVGRVLAECGLRMPGASAPATLCRDDHTPHLVELLAQMQQVARLDPQAEW